MPFIRKRIRSDGKPAYLAVWSEYPNGPEVSKAFARKADAERHLVDVQHRLLSNTYASPHLGRTPFAEVVERYRARGVWRPRTRQTVDERLRHALEHFGDRPIGSIRKGEIQAFISGLPLAPTTVRVVVQHLSAVFITAMDDGLIGGRNPCSDVRLPRVDARPLLPIAVAEVEALLAAADDWFAVAIVIGAGLGLRQSEAAGLTKDRVDFLRRTVTVDRQWQQASGSRPGGFAPPKTETSTRVIPADTWVLDMAASHLQRFGAGRDGVIIQHEGEPLDAARFGHYVRSARRRAGLDEAISFHSLRHFFASALINAGCSVKQVQSALGHRSAKMTYDVYGHLWPGEEDRVRDAIGRVFRPGGEPGTSVGG